MILIYPANNIWFPDEEEPKKTVVTGDMTYLEFEFGPSLRVGSNTLLMTVNNENGKVLGRKAQLLKPGDWVITQLSSIDYESITGLGKLVGYFYSGGTIHNRSIMYFDVFKKKNYLHIFDTIKAILKTLGIQASYRQASLDEEQRRLVVESPQLIELIVKYIDWNTLTSEFYKKHGAGVLKGMLDVVDVTMSPDSKIWIRHRDCDVFQLLQILLLSFGVYSKRTKKALVINDALSKARAYKLGLSILDKFGRTSPKFMVPVITNGEVIYFNRDRYLRVFSDRLTADEIKFYKKAVFYKVAGKVDFEDTDGMLAFDTIQAFVNGMVVLENNE